MYIHLRNLTKINLHCMKEFFHFPTPPHLILKCLQILVLFCVCVYAYVVNGLVYVMKNGFPKNFLITKFVTHYWTPFGVNFCHIFSFSECILLKISYLMQMLLHWVISNAMRNTIEVVRSVRHDYVVWSWHHVHVPWLDRACKRIVLAHHCNIDRQC